MINHCVENDKPSSIDVHGFALVSSGGELPHVAVPTGANFTRAAVAKLQAHLGEKDELGEMLSRFTAAITGNINKGHEECA